MKENYSDNFFNVSSEFGFLPQKKPISYLPEKYFELQNILDNMPVQLPDGSPGILAIPNKIEKEVDNLPNFIKEVKKENDVMIIQALFRGYCFLTSAYTLELSYQEYVKSKNYGKARNVLPKQIAEPFVFVAKKLDVFPWLDYHYAYSLGNFKFLDGTENYHWSNLDQCVKFSGKKDETGFIMNHVDINQHSPRLVQSVMESIISIKNNNNNSLNFWLEENYKAMIKVNDRRKDMWQASRWKNYNDFRIFIMGIKGNDEIFGEGLIYQGVSTEPKQYRGQTGAQDNIIPMQDIFSGVINFYPKNELTKYLLDLRKYRPKCIQYFFNDLQKDIEKINGRSVFNYLCQTNNYVGLCFLLAIVEEIYQFRNGHWQFVQKYIMANTKYAKATGGTPIISWIPNQIKAVLEFIKIILQNISNPSLIQNKSAISIYNESKKRINTKIKLLDKQLIIVRDEDYNPGKVFELNQKYNLQDVNFEKK